MTTPSDKDPRNRPRVDARHWAGGLAGSIPTGIGLIRDGTGLLEVVIAVLMIFVLVFGVAFIVIDPARHPDAPVWPVAWMYLLAGVLATVAILLIPQSVWPS
jgi:RsiW-degrading membrane proteinase PrsW (M82 family)